ncbi:hypothetical protein [Sporomusa sp.]|uniref:hypothetical protein n=1 Tax=Sporomusa sp. TaxID=2078658 RepID=UPI002BAA8C16|nr:hypothetical protein [Sporomusa sp.]HWR08861.1 hypothetical protein [Sporomusa sp.]
MKYIKQNDHIAYLVYAAADMAAGAGRRPAAEYSGCCGLTVADTHKYLPLWHRLQNSLRQTDFSTCTVDQVLAILETVAAGIPYSTAASGGGNISLYDHSRLTAALAVCLCRYFAVAGISDYRSWCAGAKKSRSRTVPAFLLVDGDLAGALPALHGRSIFVEVLLEHCLGELFAAVGLSRVHLLYSDGGRFYLLAPNIPVVTGLLETAAAAVNDWLRRQFGAALYLTLAWQEADAGALMELTDGRLCNDNPHCARPKKQVSKKKE